MSTLSRWSGKLQTRLALRKSARGRALKAQAKYERARRLKLHPREHLKNAADKADALLRRRQRQVEEARKVVARHSAAPVPHPERTRLGNRSSRGGVRPRLIVLHITVSHNRPGLSDIDGILAFFDNPSSQASSHIVNDREGHDARCVPDAEKAWTQAAFNSFALSIEQIESEVKSRNRWMNESRKQLDNTALWVANWSTKYDIPLTKSTSHGVCQHRDLGAAGGGHVDCGPEYPLDYILSKARVYKKGMK